MNSDDAAGLRIRDTTWHVANRAILSDIDLFAPAGRLTAVLGPNGSGKSSLLRAVVGAMPVDSGTWLLSGVDLATLTRRERARRVALVEQDPVGGTGLNALEAVLLGRVPHQPRLSADTAGDLAIAWRSLQRAGGSELAGRDIDTLSGGERQRVHLARALAQEPHLLLLDEPTNHLDVAAQLGLLELVRQIADAGTTCVLVLHDLNHALRWCDHVVVLSQGRVAGAGDPREVLTPELVERIYGVAPEVLVSRDGTPVLTFLPTGR